MAQYHIKLHNKWLRIKRLNDNKTICVFNLRKPIIYHDGKIGMYVRTTGCKGHVEYMCSPFECSLTNEQNETLFEFIEEHLMEGVDVERII